MLASLLGAAFVVALVAGGFAVDESLVERVEEPTNCDTYGRAMDEIIEARFPPSDEPVLVAHEVLPLPLEGFNAPFAPQEMDWECEEQRLSVFVRGPWVLDAPDTETALQVLVADLRSHDLEPASDEVELVLDSVLLEEVVRFDEARVIEDLVRSLAPGAAKRRSSLFDVYDCVGGCGLWGSPFAPE